MGQKVHPFGFRLGVFEDWHAHWFAKKDYGKELQEDLAIRKYLTKNLTNSEISKLVIDKAGDTVHAGLPSTYQLSPMRLVADTQAGTSLGSITKVSEVIVSLYKSLNVKIGDGIDEYDLDWRSTEVYDSPPNLFTGMVIVSHDGGFNTESNIVISGSDPFPCTIRAIIARIEKTGR